MTAVPVNASGSRNDLATAKAIPRVPAHRAGGQPIRLVVDSPPHVPRPTCVAVKTNGKVCGAQLRGTQQITAKICLGHLRFRKTVSNVDES